MLLVFPVQSAAGCLGKSYVRKNFRAAPDIPWSVGALGPLKDMLEEKLEEVGDASAVAGLLYSDLPHGDAEGQKSKSARQGGRRRLAQKFAGRMSDFPAKVGKSEKS